MKPTMPLLERVRAIVRAIRPKNAARRAKIARLSTEEVFTGIFKERFWGKDISVSGKGSTPEATARLSAQLPSIVEELGVRVMLDAPCGDFSWMQTVPLRLDRYIGADIVQPLIHELTAKHASPTRSFVKLNLLQSDLPECDLFFCRDCMLHLSFADLRTLFQNVLRGRFRYAMFSTYPQTEFNRDIVTGEARPLNLTAAPLGLPPPLRLVADEGTATLPRAMGVWSREQLEEWARTAEFLR